jgi:hypothetical protein
MASVVGSPSPKSHGQSKLSRARVPVPSLWLAFPLPALSVPCRSDTPTYKIQVKIKDKTDVCACMSQGPGSCHPAQGSSGGSTCPRGSGFGLPSQGSSGAATCRLGSSTRLLAQGSSGAATCPKASASVSPRRELRCCHIPHDPQRAVDHRNKERLSCPSHVASLACF